MRWPFTFYTNVGVPKGFAACTRAFVILIRPEYRNDYGLYRHELTHVFQSLTGLIFLHTFLYLISDTYKLDCEVDAYREQLKHYDQDKSELFAGYISSKYGLSITQEAALALLKE